MTLRTHLETPGWKPGDTAGWKPAATSPAAIRGFINYLKTRTNPEPLNR
jgi:hypothetical protein